MLWTRRRHRGPERGTRGVRRARELAFGDACVGRRGTAGSKVRGEHKDGATRGDARGWENTNRLFNREQGAGRGAGVDAEHGPDDNGKFDIIFVDIFDGENLTPPSFYSSGFLLNIRACLSNRGVVIHNLHSGSSTLDRCVDAATEAYAREFPRGACARVPALRRGNTIIAAAATPDVFSREGALQEAAIALRAKHEFLFDVAARCRLQPVPSPHRL